MKLRTLGGLDLVGNDFTRPKPLLLLAYLALEGPRGRRFLSELFWPDAATPMNSLRVALSQLRAGAPGVLHEDGVKIASAVAADASSLLAALDAGELERAVGHYTGAFLEGLYLRGLGAELEEWMYGTREFLAERVREAMLILAERDAAAGDFAAASRRAEGLLELPGAPALAPEALARVHRLLVAGGSGSAAEIEREARDYDIVLDVTREAARRGFGTDTVFSGPASRGSLPVPVTSFVGRELEMIELDRLLHDGVRLITVIGPGGVGKTRLALAAGRSAQRRERFGGGVHFVALETLTEASLLPGTIAAALGFPLPGLRAPLDELTAALGERHALLLLDNCEGVPGCADVVARLLSACTGLTVLATSRVRLDVAGEQLFPLEGLPFTPKETVEDAARYDAVRLFAERARRARPDFSCGPDELPHVLRICRLGDGLPLAIELAAAWVRVMGVAEIARELARDPDFLRADTHGLPDRHRSLRATFEHSWRLLAPSERTALARLSVFRGGFTREAASRVAGATIPALAALIDASLLRSAEGWRFERHPLVHGYAREKLAERPEEERAALEAHARYFLELAEALSRSAGEEQIATFERLEAERDNLRTALEWALGAPSAARDREEAGASARSDAESRAGSPAVGLGLAVALYRFWYYRSHFTEGRRWLELALERTAGFGREWAPARAQALHAAGVLAIEQGDEDAAFRHFEARLELARSLGDEIGQAASLNSLGVIAWGRNDLATAERLIEASLELRRRAGREKLLVGPLMNLGLVALAREDYAAAEGRFQECLDLTRGSPNSMARASSLSNLGALRVDQGEAEAARALFREAVALYRSLGDRDGVAHCLDGLAAVAALQRRYRAAARLTGAADALRDEVAVALNDAEEARRERRLAPARSGLSASGFLAASEEGARLGLQEAVELGLAVTRARSG